VVEERAASRWLRSERSERLETTGGRHPQPGHGSVVDEPLTRHDPEMAWTYILRCSDGSYYVGSTVDLERRLWDHRNGLGATYTRRRRPAVLVWSAEFERIDEAFAFEKQVQGWNRRKREALIADRLDELPGLASRSKKKVPRRGSA
jgi:putative endonuclease